MLGNLVQKLQSLSPLTSPTTSPTVSPRPKRKFGFGRTNRKRRIGGYAKEDIREVQSEPELDYDNPEKSKRDKSFFGLTDKRKTSAPSVPFTPNPPRGFTITPSSYFPKNNGNASYNGSANNNGHASSNGYYSSSYSSAIRSNGVPVASGSQSNIYEDVNPRKGPHISVYNISSNPPKSSVISVNIHSNDKNKSRCEFNPHASKVNVSEYSSRGPINVSVCQKKNENASSASIYESLKNIDSRKHLQEQPKSLPDHTRISRVMANNKDHRLVNDHQEYLSQTRPKIHPPLQSIPDVRKQGQSSLHGVELRGGGNHSSHSQEPRKLAVYDTRKTSFEPKKSVPPEYHRTLSSDYYQGTRTYGYINRIDEPYPLPPSPHEDIYDVPSRITRKVESSRNRDRTLHISRTVGKMEGLRQV